MTERRYPIPTLLRLSVQQHKAVVRQAKQEQLTVTAYIRAALARDVTLRRKD